MESGSGADLLRRGLVANQGAQDAMMKQEGDDPMTERQSIRAAVAGRIAGRYAHPGPATAAAPPTDRISFSQSFAVIDKTLMEHQSKLMELYQELNQLAGASEAFRTRHAQPPPVPSFARDGGISGGGAPAQPVNYGEGTSQATTMVLMRAEAVRILSSDVELLQAYVRWLYHHLEG